MNNFACHAHFIEEADGYSVIALNLPGVVSQGDTLEEATNNIKESFAVAIEFYEDSRLKIPFIDGYFIPNDGLCKWLNVHVPLDEVKEDE